MGQHLNTLHSSLSHSNSKAATAVMEASSDASVTLHVTLPQLRALLALTGARAVGDDELLALLVRAQVVATAHGGAGVAGVAGVAGGAGGACGKEDEKKDDFIEPLLLPDRLEVGDVPPERADVWDLYKRMEDSFWTVAEIDLSEDVKQWPALTPDERHYLSMVLAFFAQADGLVADNAGGNFMAQAAWREAKMCYGVQAFMEGIHNITYTEFIRALVKDPEERAHLFKAIETVPTIGAKGAWMRRYMNPDVASFAERLAAFVVAEGVFFSGSFCAIFWMRKRGKMPGLAFANELIARDEGMHAELGCLLYRKLTRRLPQHRVHAMFAAAVAVEQDFVRAALPVRLIGMNADAMAAYVEFVADFWLVALGYDKAYGTANPFEFMTLISLQGKSNMFERRIGEYSLSKGAPAEQTFRTDADF